MWKYNGRRGEEDMVTMLNKPAWLEGLMAETTFFGPCGVHENRRKSEKNVFCLDCCESICPHCLPSHSSHPLLQVRRYVYHDVVRLYDLERLIDCSYIQPYTINSAKVIFLKKRPQSRSSKCPTNICSTCERILQERFQFCSLSCKVEHMIAGGEDLGSVIQAFDKSDFAYSQFEGLRLDGDDDQVTPDTIIEDSLLFKGRADSCSQQELEDNNRGMVKKKKKNNKKGSLNILPPGTSLTTLGSRRKGNPHRSPFS